MSRIGKLPVPVPSGVDVTIDGVSGQVKVRYTDLDGKEKLANERLALPADVAKAEAIQVQVHLTREARQ